MEIKDEKQEKTVKDVEDAKDVKDGEDVKDVEDAKDVKDGEDTKEIQSATQLIIDIKKEYEQQIDLLKKQHVAEIEERDNIIKQIIGATAERHEPSASFVNKINEKRNFKKW